jgi:hypothetical protein
LAPVAAAGAGAAAVAVRPGGGAGGRRLVAHDELPLLLEPLPLGGGLELLLPVHDQVVVRDVAGLIPAVQHAGEVDAPAVDDLDDLLEPREQVDDLAQLVAGHAAALAPPVSGRARRASCRRGRG